MAAIPAVIQGLLILIAIVAAVFDLRSRRIPNWLVLTGLLIGFSINLLLYETDGLKASLMGMGLALVIYVPLFALRAMGAGDAKLMAAIGSLVGPGPWLVIFVLSAITGGILAVTLLLLKGRLTHTLRNIVFIVTELSQGRSPAVANPQLSVDHPKAVTLPHAVSIALGSIMFVCILTFRSQA
jgi:prepilin peptidase CpaA